jgi:hypothetical protein
MSRNITQHPLTTAALALVLATALPTLLAAHEGHVHSVIGTVTAVSEAELTVRDRHSEAEAIQLTAETRYLRGDQEATRADVEVGSRVAVEVVERGGALIAQEVTIGEKEDEKRDG